jgi:hypothetical protein
MSWDRRTLLKGMLGGGLVTIGLPPLEIFTNATRPAYAGDGFPKRFGVFFWGNGNIPSRWVPAGEGPAWEVSDQLQPLAPVKDKVTVVSGTAVKLTNRVPHGTGAAAVLSGAPLIVLGRDHTFSAPSLDQVLARQIGGDTRFKSLEVGVKPGAGMSFNGPNSQNPPESSPAALFDRLFNPVNGFRAPDSNAPPDPRLRWRRSVLDVVLGQASAMHAKLGAADRARLDQHLTGIRELETRIARLELAPPSLEACTAPGAPTGDFADVAGRPPLAEISAAMIDLLAFALACDQTRVFSFDFTAPLSDVLFGDAPAGHHQLTHDEPGEQPIVNGIVQTVMTEYARLLARLDQVTEGDGTLLDHTAILATSDVSFGREHSIEEYPILIGGGACGALVSGRHIRTAGDNVSRVGFSLLHAMDVPVSEFGQEAGRVTDGIAGLLA